MPITQSNFFFQAEDGIRDRNVTGVQTCALPIWCRSLVLPTLDAFALGVDDVLHLLAQLIDRGVEVVAAELALARLTQLQIGRASCRERVQNALPARAVETNETRRQIIERLSEHA